jgi:hypothetical protein
MVDKLFCVFVYIKARIWYQKCDKEDISLKPISVKVLIIIDKKGYGKKSGINCMGNHGIISIHT